MKGACKNQELEQAKYYLSKGASCTDKVGPRSICDVAKIPNKEWFILFDQHSPNWRVDKDQPLINAAESGNLIGVKFLLNKGASAYAQKSLALKQAAVGGYMDICNILIENGANKFAVAR